MKKEEAKLKIIELVKKYEQVIESRSASKYTEEETKKDFIQPLFHALGWDTQNKNEVTAEEHHQVGRPDYGFYLNGRCKFFVEAKSLKTNLQNEDFAKQAIRYSWNKGVTWAVLTDFESLKVFNAQVVDKSFPEQKQTPTSTLLPVVDLDKTNIQKLSTNLEFKNNSKNKRKKI